MENVETVLEKRRRIGLRGRDDRTFHSWVYRRAALNFRRGWRTARRRPKRRMTDSGHACPLAVRAAAFTAVIHRRTGLSPNWVSVSWERLIRPPSVSAVIIGVRIRILLLSNVMIDVGARNVYDVLGAKTRTKRWSKTGFCIIIIAFVYWQADSTQLERKKL